MGEELLKEAAAMLKVAVDAVTASKDLDNGDWSVIKETLTSTVKKRGMPKTAITAVVQIVYDWTLEEKFVKNETLVQDVLEYLAALTEGKIFVELHRARVLRRLAHITEKRGDRAAAKEIMQDLQVEAFTTMGLKEKVDFVIDQMRLVLAEKDYVRVQIVSKKLNKKTLDKPEVQLYKDQYYRYLSSYYVHEQLYLGAAESLRELLCFRNPREKEDNEEEVEELVYEDKQLRDVAVMVAIFGILSEPSEERTKLLTDLSSMSDVMNKNEDLKLLLKDFLSPGFSTWPPAKEEDVKQWVCFGDSLYPDNKDRYDLLRKKIILKNFTVVNSYFSNCTLDEICMMCHMTDVEEIEELLAKAICKKYVVGKIDKPTRFVYFGHSLSGSATLKQAQEDISKSLKTVRNITHMIEREYLIHT